MIYIYHKHPETSINIWLFINSQPGMVIDETGRKKGRQKGRTWDFSEYSYGNPAEVISYL